MKQELPDVQAGFRKGRGTRDQIANVQTSKWIIGKAKDFQKNIYFCFIDYAKVFDCVDHNKLWKILKEMRVPDHLTCLLRNQYEGQEATIKTRHGTMDWFQIEKGVRQGCILSPWLFNLIRRVPHEKSRAGWSTSQNQDCWEKYQQPQICKWHHPMAESEEELKSLLMKVKEESEKAGLILNIQKTKIMASDPITS